MLTLTTPTLPSEWYFDARHYERELEAVWYRDWVCVGRLEDIPRAGDYFLAEVGAERLIVTRDKEGKPRAFHNTCRHRGTALCVESRGRFRSGRIICPYHTWTYALTGDLVATPGRVEIDDFCPEDFSLYQAELDTWGGFIFVNVAEQAAESLKAFLGSEAESLAGWPLADMLSVKTDRRVLKCNWKIFWENYNECYHCPRLHPELCKVVDIYGRGLLDYTDDPNWRPADNNDTGQPKLAPGFRSWSPDGQTGLPVIPGLEPRIAASGMVFGSFTPSMYVIAHPDYARSVRMLPRGPEAIELIVDWLLHPDVAEKHPDKIDKMCALGRLVIEQDGRACELNQLGIRSRRHRHGVLVPQEYELLNFHDWLRARLQNTVS